MGHTNSTANLALPQFIGTDKPTWLSDVNGAFAAIDSYAGNNDAALAITDAKADTAVNDAASAVTTATNAANTAGTASTQATNAVTVAGNALTVANGINSKVGVLTDLHTTDKSSVVNAINEVKDAEGDLSSLTTSDQTSLVAAINEVAQGGGGLTNVTDNNNIGTFVDLSSYNSSSNQYTTPADGYANAGVTSGTGVGTVYIDSAVNIISNDPQMNLLVYVKKGTKLHVSLSGNGFGRFYPMV